MLTLLLSDKVRLRIYLTIMVIGLVMTRSRGGNSAFFISLTVAAVYLMLATGRMVVSWANSHSRATLLRRRRGVLPCRCQFKQGRHGAVGPVRSV